MNRNDLLKRVARRSGRCGGDVTDPSSYNSEFVARACGAFDDFLVQTCQRHDFQESKELFSLSITSGDTETSLPTGTLTGFESSIRKLYHGTLRDSSSTKVIVFKSFQWLEENYPDRTRSGSNSGTPTFFAKLGDKLYWNCQSDDDYTVYLLASHQVDRDLFSEGTSSTENPIPSLDFALISHAMSEIYAAMQAPQMADWMERKALELAQIAILEDQRKPEIIERAWTRPRYGWDYDANNPIDTCTYDPDELASVAYLGS